MGAITYRSGRKNRKKKPNEKLVCYDSKWAENLKWFWGSIETKLNEIGVTSRNGVDSWKEVNGNDSSA